MVKAPPASCCANGGKCNYVFKRYVVKKKCIHNGEIGVNFVWVFVLFKKTLVDLKW